MYQLMQFFNLKLSYMRYQVILFSTCSYGTPRFCAFLDWNWDLEVTAHLYRLNHFCNLNLTCLRYQISYVMCQLMSNMSHLFVYQNVHVFFSITYFRYILFFSITYFWYIYQFFCYSMARKRELKMPNLPLLRGGRREQCQGSEELNQITVDNLPIFTS